MREILQLMYELSQVSNLIFVGGSSLYLQGFKEKINDIDVLVQDSGEIRSKFEINFITEPLYNFGNRQRAYFISNGIMVDIFIESNDEEVVKIDYYNCCTINAQIQFLEKTLRQNLPPEKRATTIAEINALKRI